jgi:hypothetical protein
MANSALDFLKKLDALSWEVGLYFDSEAFAKYLVDLSDKYELDKDWLNERFYGLVASDFNFKDFDRAFNDLDLLPLRQKEVIKDFLGWLILPVASYLPVNVALELRLRGISGTQFDVSRQAFEEVLEDYNLKQMDELLATYEKNFDPQAEETYISDLFSKELVSVLKNNDNDSLAILNSALIRLLNNSEIFKDKILKIFYSNQEILTAKPFSLDGRDAAGTIANWLKDFIGENGSDSFNAVVLSRYIVNSNNAKNLDLDERHLVSKLLKLYRNLAFYPVNMRDVPLSEWEMVPLDHLAEVKAEPRIIAPAEPKIEKDKNGEDKKEEEIISIPEIKITPEPETVMIPENKIEIAAIAPVETEKIKTETIIPAVAEEPKKAELETVMAEKPAEPEELAELEEPEEEEESTASPEAVLAEDKESQLKALEELAATFPADSLERKVIEEEMKRL